MAIILVRFETDNDYSDSEMVTFGDAFKDFLAEMDEDAKPKSVEIKKTTEEDALADTRETVSEFIANASVCSQLVITHPDHDKPVIIEFAEGDFDEDDAVAGR